jgi:hypothetical protein
MREKAMQSSVADAPQIKDMFDLSCSNSCCPEVEIYTDGSLRITDDDGKKLQNIKFTPQQAKRLATILFGEYGLRIV